VKRRVLLAVVAALVAACRTVPLWEKPVTPVEAPIVDPARLHRATLDNGLEVLVLEDHRFPTVDLGLAVRSGSAIEGPGEEGLAVFTAELMGRGAGERTALELAGVVDALGATLDVTATWDATQITASGLSRDAGTLLALLADVAQRPRFDADEVARVRAELIAQIQRAGDDPPTLVSWAFFRAAYPGHRFALPQMGTLATAEKLGGAAARAFHRRIFTPRDAILYATGDVDAARFLDEARALFGGWRGEAVPARPSPPPPVAGPRVVIVDRPDLTQPHLLVGHEGIARGDERRMAAQLVNAALGGGGFSSRLMGTIRAEQGLTYSVASQFVQRRVPGPFVVQTFTKTENVGNMVGRILDELARLKREPPRGEELANVKRGRLGSFAVSLETTAAVAAALVDLDVYGLPPDSLDTYRRRARAVTEEEAAAIARDLIHPERALVAVAGPADALRPQLERFGPVTVEQP
jgi:zinc protease